MKKFTALSSIILFAILALNGYSQTVINYKAHAIDAKTKKPIFTGIYKEQWRGDKMLQVETTYFVNNATKATAYRKVNFKPNNQTSPEYVFENFKTGASEIIKPNKDVVDVYYKKSGELKAQKKTLKVPGNYVIDAGLLQNLRMNWTQLKSGKKLLFNIVVAQRLDYYEFMLYEKTPEHEKKQGLTRFYFVSSHWFIRKVVDPIVLVLDNETKFLTRYEGTTNLSDENGDLFLKAIITYQKL